MARPERAAGVVSYRIKDRGAGVGSGELRRAEVAEHVRTALSAHGLYEAADVGSADLIVEIDYGLGPERVHRDVYQELQFGRPVPAGERRSPPPEGVAAAVTGYAETANITVLREKHMSICARRNAAATGEDQSEDVWRVHVAIEDEGEDLRGHLPVLVSAAMDHLGRSTEGPASVVLRSDDEAVRFIRKGL